MNILTKAILATAIVGAATMIILADRMEPPSSSDTVVTSVTVIE